MYIYTHSHIVYMYTTECVQTYVNVNVPVTPVISAQVAVANGIYQEPQRPAQPALCGNS